MFFAKSSLSVLVAIIAFFTLALSASALPMPHKRTNAPETLLGRAYSRRAPEPVIEEIIVERTPAPSYIEDDLAVIAARNERFQRRAPVNRRGLGRQPGAASLLARRARAEPRSVTIKVVARAQL